MRHIPAIAAHQAPSSAEHLDRRTFLKGTGLAVAGGAGIAPAAQAAQPQPVFLARGQRYDRPLVRTIHDGLEAVGFDFASVRGRRVLLKPNLVEPSRQSPHVTTHPAVIRAAAEVFRRAARVVIGEASANLRDTELVLAESGLDDLLAAEKIEFANLNYSECQAVPNAGRRSKLKEFVFPRAVIDADLIVSLPKLKTHHWAGFTASMKNLFGVLPGIVYGWPKNLLHFAGIPETIVDVTASLPRRISIVDAILCMEGDGPIMGTPKTLGLLAVGLDPVAVDATLARIMGLDPGKVPYLALAAGRLGPIADAEIRQRGESWQGLVSPFAILNQPNLQSMRAS